MVKSHTAPGRVTGQRHWLARLTDAQVKWMRDRREYDGWTVRRIAEELGMPYPTVRDIIYYKRRVVTPISVEDLGATFDRKG